MTTLVCFRHAECWYGIPVGVTRAVHSAAGVIPLPQPRAGVVGVMPGGDPISVLAPFGAGGGRVLVVEHDRVSFGIAVDDVTGLVRVDDAEFTAPPAGQAEPVISATVQHDGKLLLLADPAALARQL